MLCLQYLCYVRQSARKIDFRHPLTEKMRVVVIGSMQVAGMIARKKMGLSVSRGERSPFTGIPDSSWSLSHKSSFKRFRTLLRSERGFMCMGSVNLPPSEWFEVERLESGWQPGSLGFLSPRRKAPRIRKPI
jgi:hypothetical protein